MNSVTRNLLQVLLSRAESAYFDGRTELQRVGISGKKVGAEYDAVTNHATLADIHAELSALEIQGALTIEWERRAGGVNSVLMSLRLIDRDAIAGAVDATPVWVLVDQARSAIQPLRELPPVPAIARCLELPEIWAAGKSVRGRGPGSALSFVDAVQVLVNLDGDISHRRLSTRLFQDSKRIEELVTELDYLTATPGAPARSRTELFDELGLLNYPKPFYAAGQGTVILNDGTKLCAPSASYFAVDPAEITSIHTAGCWVLSVENITTFMDLCAGGAGPLEGLLLYTAGMPSPRWLQAYSLTFNDRRRHFHWGDTDLGGVRILEKLAEVAISQSSNIEPHAMGVGGLDWKPFADAEVVFAVEICRRWGWLDLGTSIENRMTCIEQESQPLSLPAT